MIHDSSILGEEEPEELLDKPEEEEHSSSAQDDLMTSNKGSNYGSDLMPRFSTRDTARGRSVDLSGRREKRRRRGGRDGRERGEGGTKYGGIRKYKKTNK